MTSGCKNGEGYIVGYEQYNPLLRKLYHASGITPITILKQAKLLNKKLHLKAKIPVHHSKRIKKALEQEKQQILVTHP